MSVPNAIAYSSVKTCRASGGALTADTYGQRASTSRPQTVLLKPRTWIKAQPSQASPTNPQPARHISDRVRGRVLLNRYQQDRRSSEKPPAFSIVSVNTCSCIYTDELEVSALEDAFSQFLRHAEGCDEDGPVAIPHHFSLVCPPQVLCRP